jgi:hypothetical protein
MTDTPSVPSAPKAALGSSRRFGHVRGCDDGRSGTGPGRGVPAAGASPSRMRGRHRRQPSLTGSMVRSRLKSMAMILGRSSGLLGAPGEEGQRCVVRTDGVGDDGAGGFRGGRVGCSRAAGDMAAPITESSASSGSSSRSARSMAGAMHSAMPCSNAALTRTALLGKRRDEQRRQSGEHQL